MMQNAWQENQAAREVVKDGGLRERVTGPAQVHPQKTLQSETLQKLPRPRLEPGIDSHLVGLRRARALAAMPIT